jgi:hypothetical protein
VEELELTCYRCRVTKVESLFHRCKKNKTGRHTICIECSKMEKAAYYRSEKAVRLRKERQPEIVAWRAQYNNNPINKEKRRDAHYKHKYGVTLEEFRSILERQHHRCVVCGESPSKSTQKKFWNLDHDHDTDKVRGVLCTPCNLTLGVAKESIPRLQRCLAYLRFHKGMIKVPGPFMYSKPPQVARKSW